MLGILDTEELKSVDLSNYKPEETDKTSFTFDELRAIKLTLINNPDIYVKDSTKTNYEVNGVSYPVWTESPDYMLGNLDELIAQKGIELKISGIVRPREDATATSISGAIGYTKALTDKILAMNEESEIIKQQKATPDHNVLTGLRYERTHYTPETIGDGRL